MVENVETVKKTTKKAEPTKEAIVEERKRRRVRVGETAAPRLKSDFFNRYITDESYAYRLVNDDEYRITQVENDDWDKCVDENNKTLRQPCGTTPDGRVQYRYLMRKPKDWYNADQKEKQAPLDEIEQELLRGKVRENGTSTVEADKFYIPKDTKNKIEYK